MIHPAEQYCRDVAAGRILACRWVKRACNRHLHDLKHGKKRGLKFSPDHAQHAIDFIQHHCRHTKGRWARKYDDVGRARDTRIKLEPWQQFLVWCLFGWLKKHESGQWRRRFRTAYLEVGRKNAKTTLAAAIGNYLWWADEEPGAEVYTIATTRDQAKICHGLAVKMRAEDEYLSENTDYFRGVSTLVCDETASSFKPLAADYDTLDGLNTHGAICDELHEWKGIKGRGLWEVIETSTGSRDQSMQLGITTAGDDRESICFDLRDYLTKVLKGYDKPDGIKDDSTFGVIYTLDTARDWPDLVALDSPAERPGKREDDWKDVAAWRKANPNLGVSVDIDQLERGRDKALAMPTAVNGFLRKHLNIWVSQANRWISMELWDANKGSAVCVTEGAGRVDWEKTVEKYRGRLCYGGLDLAATNDFCALAWLFPADNATIDVVARFWCPEQRINARENKYRDAYRQWAADGWLIPTPGNAVDYATMEQDIVADAKAFRMDSMNVDRKFQGFSFLETLISTHGLNALAIGMGASLAVSCQQLEKMLLEHRINHGGNPVMRFCADNVAVTRDKNDNISPNKAQSSGKIDGIVALILGLDRYIRGGGGVVVNWSEGIVI